MNVTFPPSPTNTADSPRIPPWPHTDQHASDSGFVCAQGLLNTGPCGPRDGGLILVEGSAPLWSEFWSSDLGQAKRKASSTTTGLIGKDEYEADLTQFTPPEIKWFEKRGCVARKLALNPGDLVLWDSRTIHYNCAPQDDNIRSALYICYAPAKLADPKDLERKVGLFCAFQGTNHWPHIHVKGSGRQDGERKRPVQPHEWTNEVFQLAGVEPYE